MKGFFLVFPLRWNFRRFSLKRFGRRRHRSLEFTRLFSMTFASDVVFDTPCRHHSDGDVTLPFRVFLFGLIVYVIAKKKKKHCLGGFWNTVRKSFKFQKTKHFAKVDLVFYLLTWNFKVKYCSFVIWFQCICINVFVLVGNFSILLLRLRFHFQGIMSL